MDQPSPSFDPARFIAEASIASQKARSEFTDRLQRALAGEELPPPKPLLGPLRYYEEALHGLLDHSQLRLQLALYPEVHDVLTERILTAIAEHWERLQQEVDEQMQQREALRQQVEQAEPQSWMQHSQQLLGQLGRAYGSTAFDTEFYQQQFARLDAQEQSLEEQFRREQERIALQADADETSESTDKLSDEAETGLAEETQEDGKPESTCADPEPAKTPEPTLEQVLAAQQLLEEQRKVLARQLLEDWAKADEELREKALLAGAAREMGSLLPEMEQYLAAYGGISEALRPLFKHFPSHGWDLSSSQWSRSDLSVLEEYARLLAQNEELQELAELLGRLQASEKELKEESRVEEITKYEPKTRASAKAEYVGVETGNDLSLVLPTELSALKHPVRKKDFMKRYADRQLQQFRVQDRYLAAKSGTRIRTVQVEEDKEEKGPFVICVDTSGSMAGFPERVAKTICFAILKIALEEKREVYLISFSTRIECVELTKGMRSLPQLIDFLAHSFHGGTDADVALEEGVRKMSEQDWNKADLLIISDFIFSHLKPSITGSMNRLRQEHACRFFALLINVPEHGNSQAMAEFDRAWNYQAHSSKPLRELAELMRELKRR